VWLLLYINMPISLSMIKRKQQRLVGEGLIRSDLTLKHAYDKWNNIELSKEKLSIKRYNLVGWNVYKNEYMNSRKGAKCVCLEEC